MSKEWEDVSEMFAGPSEDEDGDGTPAVAIAEGCPGSVAEESVEVVEATIEDLMDSYAPFSDKVEDAQAKTRRRFRNVTNAAVREFQSRMLDEDSDVLDIDSLCQIYKEELYHAARAYRSGMLSLKV